ncbi:MAG: DUF3810 domain-containing protein [candidate division KSB1 bacterium]|nr:DUF3810 domain-containing protein [candidate division KSB1 bacterium]MDZ7274976.1 DUF3810 domain-containing protein [candidate division KSB1 bacterium]MDZ7286573.1 DUF3810 domain-containing protein [candidate division KSB1 bacterium]MDZ7299263.1 DUF3810 domain-containing protein [candidate division KSB1 bacterium]MDZ7306077.1 DUF3810 domain-containing protein [candidate division KSB1 bacterium]
MNLFRNRVLALATAVTAGLLLSLPVLAHQPAWIETFYSRRFYFALTGLLSPLTSAVPFSLSEICFYLGVLTMLALAGRLWRRRQWQRGLRNMLLGAALFVSWFYLAWGCNYFRAPIDEQLGLAGGTAPDSLAYRRHLEESIVATNNAWRPVPAWNLTGLDSLIECSLRRLLPELSLPLAPGSRRPKHLLMSAVLDYTLTSGFFSPFLHEIHLNAGLLPVELPFVLAHEKAHQLGYARESEASFLGVLASLASTDSAVQYSGHLALLQHFLARAALFKDADSLRQRVRPEVRADLLAVQQRWQPYHGVVSHVTQRTYDAYLRANRVRGGRQNYGEVVELMMRWREQPRQEK